MSLHERPITDEIRIRGDAEARELEIRIVPWDVVADTPDGREVFTRGAFDGTDPERVTIEAGRHGGELVGRGTGLDERDDAAYLTARVSRTRAGDELLELVRDGVYRAASVAFADRPGGSRRRPDGVWERRAVDLRRVAVLERGAYAGAEVLAVRGDHPMDQIESTGVVPTELPAPLVAPELTAIGDRLGQIEARIGALSVIGGNRSPGPMHYRADTLGQLLTRAWEDPELRTALSDAVHERALVDQITGDNPGLMPPAVIRQAAVIVNRGRPGISAIGTDPLPADGMTVSWPILTTPLTGLIAKQTAEKAAVVSAKVSFGNATSPIATYAGGSDVSYQLIRRSQPSYLEQYSRVMLAAWAQVTDLAHMTAVLAGATGTVVLAPGATANAIVAALVDASLKVEAATGQPATAVVVASDLFASIAKAFAGSSINPTSEGGTAMASTLRVNVSGLSITNDPYLAAGTGVITNGLAAAWLEDGPFQITVDDAEKIGQNVAYWSLGASAVYIPAGVVKIVAA